MRPVVTGRIEPSRMMDGGQEPATGIGVIELSTGKSGTTGFGKETAEVG
jgi:hypothetical protein